MPPPPSSRSLPRGTLSLNVAVGAAIAGLEALWASLAGKPLPLPLWYGGFGGLLLLGLVAGWVLTAHLCRRVLGSVRPAALAVGTAGCLLKGWIATGSWFSPSFLVLAFLLLIAVVVPAPGGATGNDALRVLLVSVLLAAGSHHVDPAVLRGWNSTVILLAAGWGLLWVAGKPLLALLRCRPRTALGVLALFLIAAGGVWQYTAPAPSWRNPSPFRGEIDEPRFAGDPRDLPNIVLISLDTLRWDMVPGRESSPPDVPGLRRLRTDSVRFPKTFSTSSWTLPAHASLFTGLLPGRHGAVGFRTMLSPESHEIHPDVPLYTQFLKRLGYATAGFTGGKLVGSQHGFARGYDRYWEHPDPRGSNEAYGDFVPEAVKLAAFVLDGTRYAFSFASAPTRGESEDSGNGLRFFHHQTDRARHWIRGRSGTRPFFLFLHTYQIHDWHHMYPESLRQLQERHPALSDSLMELVGRSELPNRPRDWQRLRNTFRLLPLEQWPRIKLIERLGLRRARERIDVFTSPPEPYVKQVMAHRADTAWEEFKKPPEHLPRSARRRYREVLAKFESRENFSLAPLVARMTPRQRHYARIQLAFLEKQAVEAAMQFDPRKIRQFFITLHPGILRGMKTLNRSQWRALKHLYRIGIERTDRTLHDFLRFLRRNDLYDSTLIVLLSDHGEGFVVDHGVFHHGKNQMNELLMRVPLWVKLPDNRKAGTVYDGTLQITDVFPMILDHLGVTFPDVPSGIPRNVLDEVGEKNVRGRRYARGSLKTVPHYLPPLHYLRGATHKLIFAGRGELPSYWAVSPRSLGETPVETREIPAEVHHRLRRRMERFVVRMQDYPDPYRTSPIVPPDETRDRLKALPYIH